jgi:heme O synthase-like polyprenyltransferase
LLKKNDYARASVPMLPVIWGDEETRATSCSTRCWSWRSRSCSPRRVAGGFFLVAALLGAGFLFYAVWLLRNRGSKIAWRLAKILQPIPGLDLCRLVVDRFISGS